MATKKKAKVMSKEELVEKLTLEQEEKAIKKSKKSSGKKPTEKALKVAKKVTKKAEKQVEEKNPVEAEKAPVAKKATVKKNKKEKENPVEAKKEEENPMDKLFPKTIEVEGTKFSRVQISSWEEFKEFVTTCQSEGSLHVVIACNWPKKYSKDYDANNQGEKLFPKDGFE